MIEQIEILGLFATLLSTIATMPQAIKIIRSGNADDVSLETYIILTISYFVWGYYGYHTGAESLVFASMITSVTSTIIVYMKLKLMFYKNSIRKYELQ